MRGPWWTTAPRPWGGGDQNHRSRPCQLSLASTGPWPAAFGLPRKNGPMQIFTQTVGHDAPLTIEI